MIPVEAIQQMVIQFARNSIKCHGSGNEAGSEAWSKAAESLQGVITKYASSNTNRADGHGEDDRRDGQTDSV